MYILANGCQWRAIPKDLPPKSTIYDYFRPVDYDGHIGNIHTHLCEVSRAAQRRPARPPPSSIVKASRARKRGLHHPHRYDAGKKSR